ncbi:hypothetical protein [Diaphorobacter sp. J5-51]|uniref:hypothetical protein n=1 Tax=Diaphorobacter sp. J5-51 TaxID=680496 RepID=UPI0006439935|nr:hypothetical protein [Diaphorobacter sp. J5-51]KLR57429.1 hypothetical protein OX89_12470 [Diaphorobacter sp. J5-51]
MTKQAINEKCAGYIQLVFFDDKNNEVITIGGAGFLTEPKLEEAWKNLPTFNGKSSFQADLLDGQGDIVDEKTVNVVTCETLMSKPITTLIAEGRAKLAAELARYHSQA